MLKHVLIVVAILAVALLLSAIPYFALGNFCAGSLAEYQLNNRAAEKGAEARKNSQPESNTQQKQSADLMTSAKIQKSIIDEIQSTNASNHAGNKPRHWGRDFWCEVKATDVALALFTFFLVAIGAWQGWQLKQTVDATREIGNAAIAVELPIVRASYIGPDMLSTPEPIEDNGPYGGHVVQDGPLTKYSVVSDIEFKNYGRTPAFVKNISVGFTVGNTLPTIPTFTKTVPCAPNVQSIKTDEERRIEIDFMITLTDEQILAVNGLTLPIWLYCLLRYEDAISRLHEAGFCWQWGKQNPADSGSYFFDAGKAPAIYTRKT
jgi:hypothetical protein